MIKEWPRRFGARARPKRQLMAIKEKSGVNIGRRLKRPK
jgi:hypothetical protein